MWDEVAAFSFTGREWNPALGLQYNRARWMQPRAGSFCSLEPLLMERLKGLPRYAYAANSPIILMDPRGEFIPAILAAAGGLTAVAKAAIAWIAANKLAAFSAALLLETGCSTVVFSELGSPDAWQARRAGRDLYGHCVVGCRLSRCGTRALSWFLSQGWEYLNDWFGTAPFDPTDHDAVMFGARCSFCESCTGDSCCGKFRGQPSW